MKQFFLLISLILISHFTFSQDDSTPSKPTTLEEYNYLTKGYQIQLESGLDMKRGYRLESLGVRDIKVDDYQFTFQMLIREEENELAAILSTIKSDISGKTYFLCIPHGNAQLSQMYFESYKYFDSSISKAYIKVLSDYFSVFAVALWEANKQSE